MSCDCDYICEPGAVDEQHYFNCSSRCGRTDRKVYLKNKHLKSLQVDHLHHLALDTSQDLPKKFGDVKFVCLGGTQHRMRNFAEYMSDHLGLPMSKNLSESGHRYAMYKVGPVLAVSHGIGIPSMITALQEVIKLMSYAQVEDPIFIRIGTSGGLTKPSGTVVVSSCGVNGTLKTAYELPILGKIKSYPALLDKRLAEEMVFLSSNTKGYEVITGKTMGCDDFYRGQGRLDGPFCDYEEADKLAFLRKLADMGVTNIEMEATAFSALTFEAGIRAAIVCVTYVDRLKGDQVTLTSEQQEEFQKRPMAVVNNLIQKYLENRPYVPK